MKKVILFFAIWLALLTLVYLLYSEDNSALNSKSEINKQIELLENKYGNKLFKAFYCIDELRPFSIVQIDKVLETYDNTWVSPSIIINKLDNKDKTLLIKRISEYILSFDDDLRQKQIMLKLINWCKADTQFEFMNQELGIYKDDILKVISNNYNDKQAISKNTENDIVLSGTSEKEKSDFAYYQTLNQISTLTTKEQMKYYGNIYIELASIGNK